MSANLHQPSLPLEIILSVIDFILPSPTRSPIALAPNHPTTKTLLALVLTSRSIYPIARRLLYTHCMYIDTTQRLFLLLGTLTKPPQIPLSIALPSAITSLYLRPFPERHDIHDEVGYSDRLDINVALATRDLMSLVRSNLRRLVIDMPLRGDINQFRTRSALRFAFNDLPRLEEFCSVRDELYLPSTAYSFGAAWHHWPRLRTLALYNQYVNLGFLFGLQKSKHLETVVLTRSDGLDEISLQQEWSALSETAEDVRLLDFVLVNVESDHPTLIGRDHWKDTDKLKVRELNVPTSYYGDEDCIELCQQWVRRKFLMGEPVSEWT